MRARTSRCASPEPTTSASAGCSRPAREVIELPDVEPVTDPDALAEAYPSPGRRCYADGGAEGTDGEAVADQSPAQN